MSQLRNLPAARLRAMLLVERDPNKIETDGHPGVVDPLHTKFNSDGCDACDGCNSRDACDGCDAFDAIAFSLYRGLQSIPLHKGLHCHRDKNFSCF